MGSRTLSWIQASLGSAIALLACVGALHADTGPGGGCHPDIYIDTNADRLQGLPQVLYYCKKIDCPLDCPQGGTSVGTINGHEMTSCDLCPGMPAHCAVGTYEQPPGDLHCVCIMWPCPDGVCIGGGYAPGEPFAGQGYDDKYTCWCD